MAELTREELERDAIRIAAALSVEFPTTECPLILEIVKRALSHRADGQELKAAEQGDASPGSIGATPTRPAPAAPSAMPDDQLIYRDGETTEIVTAHDVDLLRSRLQEALNRPDYEVNLRAAIERETDLGERLVRAESALKQAQAEAREMRYKTMEEAARLCEIIGYDWRDSEQQTKWYAVEYLVREIRNCAARADHAKRSGEGE